jgi:hypothetical protein
MAFAWQTRQLSNPGMFELYLRSLGKAPSWLSGITIHHTAIPTLAQWNGAASMAALARYYRDDLKWPAGPQGFITDKDIWQGTPFYVRGVHAGRCNSYRIGLEVVGFYDDVGWSDGTRFNVVGVCAALCRWANIPYTSIVGHRDCMPNQKTCPGRAINMAEVREWVRREMTLRKFVISVPVLNIRQARNTVAPVATQMRAGDIFTAKGVDVGERITIGPKVTDLWGHRADEIGFGSLAGMEEIGVGLRK